MRAAARGRRKPHDYRQPKRKPVPLVIVAPLTIVLGSAAIAFWCLDSIIERGGRAMAWVLGPGIEADEDARIIQELEVRLARVEAGDSDLPG